MGSFAVWGPSRSDLDRLAWSVATAIDEGFAWIEMTEGNAPPGSRELEVLEEIGLERIDRLDRADLLVPEPLSEGAGAAGSTAAPRRAGLPHRLRRHLERAGRPKAPRALVLANLDRVLDLVPEGGPFLASLVAGAQARQLSLIATFGLAKAPSLDPFDCLVRVSAGPDGNEWNPIVDWTSRSAEVDASVPPPPPSTPHHRDVVRHLRSRQASPL